MPQSLPDGLIHGSASRAGARMGAADFNASRCMCALRADSAHLERSCGASVPTGSTSRSNRSGAASWRGLVPAARSCVSAHDSYAQIHPSSLRICGVLCGVATRETLGRRSKDAATRY